MYISALCGGGVSCVCDVSLVCALVFRGVCAMCDIMMTGRGGRAEFSALNRAVRLLDGGWRRLAGPIYIYILTLRCFLKVASAPWKLGTSCSRSASSMRPGPLQLIHWDPWRRLCMHEPQSADRSRRRRRASTMTATAHGQKNIYHFSQYNTTEERRRRREATLRYVDGK